jgi:hypothetical protein
MKKISKISLLVVLTLALSAPLVSYATGYGGKGGKGGPGFDDDVQDYDPNDIPLDGGLSILAIAGAAYGAKKLKDNRKAKAEK